VGDKKVGKSSIMLRLVKKKPTKSQILKISKFEMSYDTTTMMNTLNNKAIKLQLVLQVAKC